MLDCFMVNDELEILTQGVLMPELVVLRQVAASATRPRECRARVWLRPPTEPRARLVRSFTVRSAYLFTFEGGRPLWDGLDSAVTAYTYSVTGT